MPPIQNAPRIFKTAIAARWTFLLNVIIMAVGAYLMHDMLSPTETGIIGLYRLLVAVLATMFSIYAIPVIFLFSMFFTVAALTFLPKTPDYRKCRNHLIITLVLHFLLALIYFLFCFWARAQLLQRANAKTFANDPNVIEARVEAYPKHLQATPELLIASDQLRYLMDRLESYTQKHGGPFPPSLDDLADSPLPDWFHAADYEYLGAGLPPAHRLLFSRNWNSPTQILIVIIRRQPLLDQQFVYGAIDSNIAVRSADPLSLQELLQQDNQTREKLKLPPHPTIHEDNILKSPHN